MFGTYVSVVKTHVAYNGTRASYFRQFRVQNIFYTTSAFAPVSPWACSRLAYCADKSEVVGHYKQGGPTRIKCNFQQIIFAHIKPISFITRSNTSDAQQQCHQSSRSPHLYQYIYYIVYIRDTHVASPNQCYIKCKQNCQHVSHSARQLIVVYTRVCFTEFPIAQGSQECCVFVCVCAFLVSLCECFANPWDAYWTSANEDRCFLWTCLLSMTCASNAPIVIKSVHAFLLTLYLNFGQTSTYSNTRPKTIDTFLVDQ